jgi:hypothetical protein
MERLTALFDMDDTLCDYLGQLKIDLRKFFSEQEIQKVNFYERIIPSEIKEKMRTIKRMPGWWANLPRLEDGFQLWNLTRELGFANKILTKGPYQCDNAYTEKRQWQKRELPDAKGFTITDDKSEYDGTILIDDFPPYLKSWLDKHPGKLGIMPLKEYNLGFKDFRVIPYTGQNLNEIKERLQNDIIFK